MTDPAMGRAGHADRHAIVRQHNEARILEAIAAAGQPISRVALAAATGLSKPTVNALVDDLLASGLLREAGTRTGAVGRPASLVEVNPDAGIVVALAFDADGLSAVIADVGGVERARVQAPLAKPDRLVSESVALVERALREAGVAAAAVQAVSVSAPGILEPDSQRRALAQNVPGLDDVRLRRLLAERFDAAIAFENDVNLAAIGEHRHGIAAGATDFVFLLVDTGVGMGLMLNGELLRGSRGAAGEAGYLPLGAQPLVGRVARIGSLESEAGLSGLLARYRAERALRGSPGGRVSLPGFLDALADRDPAALATAEAEVALVARAVLAACVLVDPQFVVLAGRIGSQPFVLDGVRKALARVSPYPIEVHPSALDGSAAVTGAVARGLQLGRERLGLPAG